MSVEPNGDRRRAELEAWWALIARVLGFFLGSGMLIFETVSGGDRPYVLAAGIGLAGPAVAKYAEGVVASIRGGAKNESG